MWCLLLTNFCLLLLLLSLFGLIVTILAPSALHPCDKTSSFKRIPVIMVTGFTLVLLLLAGQSHTTGVSMTTRSKEYMRVLFVSPLGKKQVLKNEILALLILTNYFDWRNCVNFCFLLFVYFKLCSCFNQLQKFYRYLCRCLKFQIRGFSKTILHILLLLTKAQTHGWRCWDYSKIMQLLVTDFFFNFYFVWHVINY